MLKIDLPYSTVSPGERHKATIIPDSPFDPTNERLRGWHDPHSSLSPSGGGIFLKSLQILREAQCVEDGGVDVSRGDRVAEPVEGIGARGVAHHLLRPVGDEFVVIDLAEVAR